VRIAFRRGSGSGTRALAALRSDDRHLGCTLGTPLSLVLAGEAITTKSERLSSTDSERQQQFQPVY
jgi:hypothetical protein